MREAIRGVVHHAFTVLDLSRIEAACLPENAASRGVLEKSASSTRASRRPICRSTAAGATMCSMPTCAPTGAGAPMQAEPSSPARSRTTSRSPPPTSGSPNGRAALRATARCCRRSRPASASSRASSPRLGPREHVRHRRGTIPVISALATLAYDGRRGAFFEQQLTAALRILQNGDTTPERDDRQLGRGHGPYPVHPDLVSSPMPSISAATGGATSGRTIRPTRSPRRRRTCPLGLAARPALGAEVRLPPGFAGPTGRGTAARLGAQWARRACATWTAARARSRAGLDPHPRRRLGPGLHGLPQLRGDPALQQRGELRDRRRPPVGPDAAAGRDPRQLPARCPRPDHRRPARSAAAADRARASTRKGPTA
jgi:hypothetical protein